MAKIFITGSADGLGQLAAKALISSGHEVVIHARNEQRAADARLAVPGAKAVLTADLSDLKATIALAGQANALGRFDAVIHNAGLYQVDGRALSTEGYPVIFAVNTLAPYILTSLMERPGRLVYLSSGMHLQGDAGLKGLKVSQAEKMMVSYSDTKLHDLIISKAVARMWPEVYSNAVDPGWVPTKMGGAGAPDDLQKGYETQVWLATAREPAALVSGRYFHHKKQAQYLRHADDLQVQESLLALCKEATGLSII